MTRIDIASRVIAAPPEQVFEALLNPQALSAWLPPEGMTGRFDSFDAQPGGTYRMVLTYVEATDTPGKSSDDADVVEGRFVDIVSPERVVQAVDFESDDPAFSGTMTMTWELSEAEDGTRIEIRAENVPSGISAKDHQDGLNSSLWNLADYLDQ